MRLRNPFRRESVPGPAAPLVRVTRTPHRELPEFEDVGSFGRVIDQMETIRRNAPGKGDRKQRVKVVILVTSDPETGRAETFDVGRVRTTLRLGRRWDRWATYWEGYWDDYQALRRRGKAPHPDDATLLREAAKAGARFARAAVVTID